MIWRAHPRLPFESLPRPTAPRQRRRFLATKPDMVDSRRNEMSYTVLASGSSLPLKYSAIALIL